MFLTFFEKIVGNFKGKFYNSKVYRQIILTTLLGKGKQLVLESDEAIHHTQYTHFSMNNTVLIKNVYKRGKIG